MGTLEVREDQRPRFVKEEVVKDGVELYWDRHIWENSTEKKKQAEKCDEVVFESDSKASTNAMKGGARLAQGVNVTHRYLVNENGEVVDGYKIKLMSAAAHQFFSDYYKQTGTLAENFKELPSHIRDRFINSMEWQYTELMYCSYRWKTVTFGSVIFSNFRKAKRKAERDRLRGKSTKKMPSGNEVHAALNELLDKAIPFDASSTGDGDVPDETPSGVPPSAGPPSAGHPSGVPPSTGPPSGVPPSAGPS